MKVYFAIAAAPKFWGHGTSSLYVSLRAYTTTFCLTSTHCESFSPSRSAMARIIVDFTHNGNSQSKRSCTLSDLKTAYTIQPQNKFTVLFIWNPLKKQTAGSQHRKCLHFILSVHWVSKKSTPIKAWITPQWMHYQFINHIKIVSHTVLTTIHCEC